MKAVLVGVKRLDYISKKTGHPVKGLELHFERTLFPSETKAYAPSSLVVFTEFISDDSDILVETCKNLSLPASVNLEYISNGRFNNLANIEPIA